MTNEEAIKFFGHRAIMAEKLGVTLHVTYRWDEQMPMLRQYQVERLSNGRLKADD